LTTSLPYNTATTTSQPLAMIAMDLDGTILERGSHIRPELIDRLVALAQDGVRCVTATGRPFDFQVETFALHAIPASAGVFSAIIADEREIFLLNESGDRYVPHSPWNDAVRERWETLFPLAMQVLEAAEAESARRGWATRRIHSDEESFERGLPTINLDDPEKSQAICDWVKDHIRANDYPLASNRNVYIVQVFDAQVGKGPVLAELCRVLEIDPAQTLAVGDSTNDLSMLDGGCGFQVATMNNADFRVKDLVRGQDSYIASADAGLGVAEIIDTLFAPVLTR
jgi:HAD superfamily hydrolase (TIGR01484 family)